MLGKDEVETLWPAFLEAQTSLLGPVAPANLLVWCIAEARYANTQEHATEGAQNQAPSGQDDRAASDEEEWRPSEKESDSSADENTSSADEKNDTAKAPGAVSGGDSSCNLAGQTSRPSTHDSQEDVCSFDDEAFFSSPCHFRLM